MDFDSDTDPMDVAVRRLRTKMDGDFEPELETVKLPHFPIGVQGYVGRIDVDGEFGGNLGLGSDELLDGHPVRYHHVVPCARSAGATRSATTR